MFFAIIFILSKSAGMYT